MHYAWVKKGDLFSLRGDITQPLAFGLLILILLLLRVPVIRNWATGLRDRFKQAG